ncbi:MAG: hypothetical protein ABIX01_15000 [Chitinophagaceae bacterium]
MYQISNPSGYFIDYIQQNALESWAFQNTIPMQIIQSIQNRIYELRGERVMLD